MEEAQNIITGSSEADFQEEHGECAITATDNCPWYAVYVFNNSSEQVSNLFKSNKLTHFIPMELVDYVDHDEKVRHKLRPVVRNMIFLKKTTDEKEIKAMLNDIPYPISVIKKERFSPDYYEIPARQMYEFQLMCDPRITMRKFISEQEAQLKKGAPVLVKYGPLKGVTGKLVRANKKYYLLKEVPGLAVMLKVSRWCCVPFEG